MDYLRTLPGKKGELPIIPVDDRAAVAFLLLLVLGPLLVFSPLLMRTKTMDR